MQIIKLDTEILRFVFTTDWHLTDQHPISRTKAYREQVMAKVAFIRDLTQKLKAVGLFGGDMFHAKEPRAVGNTFSLTGRLIDTLYGFYLGKVFGTHGNHDLHMDRVDSIPHQPIGTVIAAAALQDLSTGSVIFENADGSSRVQVDAYPYTNDDMYALQRVLAAPPREEGVTHRIVLMHQYGNPGTNPHMHDKPTIGFNRMAECDYDFALWGHDHSRTETITVGRCTHVRLGSLARAALDSDQVDRPIAAAVLSFKGSKVGFKEVPVPVEPFEVAFVAANRAVEKVRESEEVGAYFKDVAAESEAVTEYLKELDLAVDDGDAAEPVKVMEKLCPAGERATFELAVDLCGF